MKKVGKVMDEIVQGLELATPDEEVRKELRERLPVGTLCPAEPQACNGTVVVGGRLLDCPHLDECPFQDARAQHRDQRVLKALGVGRALWGVMWEGIPQDVAEPLLLYRDTIRQRLRAGQGWGLSGPVGAGKTAALALTGRAAAEVGADVQYLSVAEMLARFHDGASPTFFAVSDLLLLDDLGAEYIDARRYNLAKLQQVVDLRWERELPICFTTNLSRKTLLEMPELSRTFSRLDNRCAWLVTRRESQRRRARTADWLEEG